MLKITSIFLNNVFPNYGNIMKILIVDDNQSITGMLSKYLKLKNFEVSVANGGRTGLNLIQNNEFDTILLDLSMPDFSGMDVIDALEKDGKLKDKKIVLFTASSITNELLDQLLRKEGIKACVKKPVKLEELIQVIST